MNENNQPQSQQTKRERGLYHVKRNGYWTVAEYTDHHGQWRVFNNTDQMQSRDFEEIDERRIERGDSPTEQPGDAKHTPGHWLHSKASVYIKRENDNDLWVAECRTYDDAAFIARAPDLLSEVSTLRSKQAELVAENARLKAECSSHEKERYEIYSFDSSQAMEIKALQKELEQLRSERDKMREENERLKDVEEKLRDAYEYMKKCAENLEREMLEKAKSALSGGSKQ